MVSPPMSPFSSIYLLSTWLGRDEHYTVVYDSASFRSYNLTWQPSLRYHHGHKTLSSFAHLK